MSARHSTIHELHSEAAAYAALSSIQGTAVPAVHGLFSCDRFAMLLMDDSSGVSLATYGGFSALSASQR